MFLLKNKNEHKMLNVSDIILSIWFIPNLSNCKPFLYCVWSSGMFEIFLHINEISRSDQKSRLSLRVIPYVGQISVAIGAHHFISCHRSAWQSSRDRCGFCPRLVFSVNNGRGQMWRLHSGCLLNAAKRGIIPSCVTDARTRPSRHLLSGHACAARRRDPATLGFLCIGEWGEKPRCSRNSHRKSM